MAIRSCLRSLWCFSQRQSAVPSSIRYPLCWPPPPTATLNSDVPPSCGLPLSLRPALLVPRLFEVPRVVVQCDRVWDLITEQTNLRDDRVDKLPRFSLSLRWHRTRPVRAAGGIREQTHILPRIWVNGHIAGVLRVVLALKDKPLHHLPGHVDRGEHSPARCCACAGL